ncbi:MAG: hypothetical protein AAF656_10825, partial [Planctomycetota bacterium]
MTSLNQATRRVAALETLEPRKLLADATLDLNWGDDNPDVPDGIGTITVTAPSDINVRSYTDLPGGATLVSGQINSSPSVGFALLRNADGSLDTSFGTDGEQRYDFGGFEKVLPQTDGTFVALVAGRVIGGPSLVKLAADGSITEVLLTSPPELDGFSVDVEPLANGNFLVVSDNGMALVAGTGGLVESFGNNGVVQFFSQDFILFDPAAAVVNDDGSILLAGQENSITTSNDFAQVRRFNADGSPDLLFGTDGIFQFDE